MPPTARASAAGQGKECRRAGVEREEQRQGIEDQSEGDGREKTTRGRARDREREEGREREQREEKEYPGGAALRMPEYPSRAVPFVVPRVGTRQVPKLCIFVFSPISKV